MLSAGLGKAPRVLHLEAQADCIDGQAHNDGGLLMRLNEIVTFQSHRRDPSEIAKRRQYVPRFMQITVAVLAEGLIAKIIETDLA